MVVAKTVFRGVVLAVLTGTSVQAGPMLSLATTGMSSQNTVSFAPRYASTALNLALGSSSNNSAPAVSTPVPAQAAAPRVYVAPAPAPAPVQVSAPAPAAAPVMFARSIPSQPAGLATADAFLNMGSGPYAAASSVTAGGSQAWWSSPQVSGIFGGLPNDQQRGLFIQSIRDRVQQTFNQSGVPLNLTTDPNAPAAHSLSVVSGTYSPILPSAIGMTLIGGDGFTFIDQAARAASNVDQLSWIVAHNVAHELMLAFGVPENHDTSGNFIDARNANWDMMVNPNATFSPSAAADLLSRNFRDKPGALTLGAQLVEPAPVPEPATIALWSVAAGLAVLVRHRRTRVA